MNLISLVIDGLHVGYLGCYGNSWIATPNVDRLAADGFLFDQALIDSPDLAAQYASLFAASHSAGPGSGQQTSGSLIDRLRAGGLQTTLITDDPAVADMPWAENLDDVIRVERQYATTAADDIPATDLARLFAVVGQWLETAAEPFALLVHCGSVTATWDAPLELRQSYWDQSEPLPPADVAAPCRLLPENYDPDELLGICQAYAGQITLLDTCLGVLLDDLERLPLGARTLLSLKSARGFPLGEHRRIGLIDHSLYAELVHIPWILRFADRRGASDRSQALVQSRDFAPTVLSALGLDVDDARSTGGLSLLPLVVGEPVSRDRLIVVNDQGERAIRTPAWYLKTPAGAPPESRHAGSASELYAKPDDRWEVNDVANRCPEVVDLLVSLVDEELQSTSAVPHVPLPDVLISGDR